MPYNHIMIFKFFNLFLLLFIANSKLIYEKQDVSKKNISSTNSRSSNI